jgi:hypothetical protein
VDEIVQFTQMLLDYAAQNAGNLNPESQRVLAEFIQNLLQFIEQETANVEGLAPQGAAPLEPTNMVPGGFESSNIHGFKYDPQSKQLLVQFHGPYPQAAGPIYRYTGVPQNTFDVVARGQLGPRTSGQNRYHKWQRNIAPSLGASVYALIREGGYPYQRVS